MNGMTLAVMIVLIPCIAAVLTGAVLFRLSRNFKPFRPRPCEHTYLIKDFGDLGQITWCPKCDPERDQVRLIRPRTFGRASA